MTNKTTNLTFRLPSDLKQKFVEEAKANGTTATALFHQWMEDYINGKKPSTDNVSADSTNSTYTAQTPSTDSTDTAHTDKLDSLESRVNELSEESEYQSQKHESLINYLNQLRDRVEALENWKQPINDSLQADQQSISALKEKVEALENSTSTAHTDCTNNNETPASEKKSGGIEPNQHEDGETTIPQEKDKCGHHSTDSTDDAHTEESDYSESPATEESEGSAIAPMTQETLGKRLKISGRGLANHREKGNVHLMEWTKQRDPEGISWQYGEDKKYHPIAPPSS